MTTTIITVITINDCTEYDNKSNHDGINAITLMKYIIYDEEERAHTREACAHFYIFASTSSTLYVAKCNKIYGESL